MRKLKKLVRPLLVLMMLGLLMPLATAFADAPSGYQGIMPLVTATLEMTTSADATLEVDAGDTLEVTIDWRRAFLATGEPIRIEATNGAVVDTSSFLFTAGSNVGSVSNIVQNGGVTTLMTSAPVNPPLLNRITFNVVAPTGASDFTVSVTVGGVNGNMTVARTFAVNATLSVTASANTVIGSTPFFVNIESGPAFGLATIRFRHIASGAIDAAISGNFNVV